MPPMPVLTIPPGTRQGFDPKSEGECVLGRYGFCPAALPTQLGSTGTSPVSCTPPRPFEKYGFHDSGKPGTCVGSPLCPAIEKFSTYAPPNPFDLSKK